MILSHLAFTKHLASETIVLRFSDTRWGTKDISEHLATLECLLEAQSVGPQLLATCFRNSLVFYQHRAPRCLTRPYHHPHSTRTTLVERS